MPPVDHRGVVRGGELGLNPMAEQAFFDGQLAVFFQKIELGEDGPIVGDEDGWAAVHLSPPIALGPNPLEAFHQPGDGRPNLVLRPCQTSETRSL